MSSDSLSIPISPCATHDPARMSSNQCLQSLSICLSSHHYTPSAGRTWSTYNTFCLSGFDIHSPAAARRDLLSPCHSRRPPRRPQVTPTICLLLSGYSPASLPFQLLALTHWLFSFPHKYTYPITPPSSPQPPSSLLSPHTPPFRMAPCSPRLSCVTRETQISVCSFSAFWPCYSPGIFSFPATTCGGIQ